MGNHQSKYAMGVGSDRLRKYVQMVLVENEFQRRLTPCLSRTFGLMAAIKRISSMVVFAFILLF